MVEIVVKRVGIVARKCAGDEEAAEEGSGSEGHTLTIRMLCPEDSAAGADQRSRGLAVDQCPPPQGLGGKLFMIFFTASGAFAPGSSEFTAPEPMPRQMSVLV